MNHLKIGDKEMLQPGRLLHLLLTALDFLTIALGSNHPEMMSWHDSIGWQIEFGGISLGNFAPAICCVLSL